MGSYRRFTKEESLEETETMELDFYNAEDAHKHICAGSIRVENHALRTAPKMLAPLKISRVCKTIDPMEPARRSDVEYLLETMRSMNILSRTTQSSIVPEHCMPSEKKWF